MKQPVVVYRMVECRQTCVSCPAQWEGKTDDGRMVYIRHRFGHGYANVSEPGGDLPVLEGEEVASWEGGHSFDGALTQEQMVAVTAERLDWSGCVFS